MQTLQSHNPIVDITISKLYIIMVRALLYKRIKIVRSCPALHTLSVTFVTSAVTTLHLFQHNIQLGLFLEGTLSKQSILHINIRENREIKNGQSRETGNIGYSRHKMKTNKTKNTTQKTKTMSNTDPTKNPGVNPDAREAQAVYTSHKTPAMLLI